MYVRGQVKMLIRVLIKTSQNMHQHSKVTGLNKHFTSNALQVFLASGFRSLSQFKHLLYTKQQNISFVLRSSVSNCTVNNCIVSVA